MSSDPAPYAKILKIACIVALAAVFIHHYFLEPKPTRGSVPAHASDDAAEPKSNGTVPVLERTERVIETTYRSKKTILASISMYSRKESCHNPRGKECLTASGRDTKSGATVACPRAIKLGVYVDIGGHRYRCEDRTALWIEKKYGPTFDIFTEDYQEAKSFGRKTLEVTILP